MLATEGMQAREGRSVEQAEMPTTPRDGRAGTGWME